MSGLEPFRRRLDGSTTRSPACSASASRSAAKSPLYKSAHEIPMMQPDRVVEVRARYLARGAEADLPADFSADLFELLIAATCRMEDEIIDELTQAREEQAS